MSVILDTNHDTTTRLARLKAAGFTTIFRYLNRHNPGGEKTIKAPEARAIAAAGLQLALVYEYTDRAAMFFKQAGADDAKWSAQYLPMIGAPPGVAVYFAVDFDASRQQFASLIVPYFEGICDSLGPSQALRVGVYGSGFTCQSLLDQHLVELTWLSCSMGWTGSHDFLKSNRWNIHQHVPQTVVGLDTDPDDINPATPDFGAFTPFKGVVA